MNSLISTLQKGGVAVIPTDTLYGLVAQALNKESVLRVFSIKKRTPTKPFIILISSFSDLSLFDVFLDEKTLEVLKRVWPGKVSIILPLLKKESQETFEYLHRGTSTLAFRLPRNKELLDLVKETGPLIAPSANREGEKTVETILEAKAYFKEDVDWYLDGGKVVGEPSTLISLIDGKIKILRQGATLI